MRRAPYASKTSLLPLQSIAIYCAYRELLSAVSRSCLVASSSLTQDKNKNSCGANDPALVDFWIREYQTSADEGIDSATSILLDAVALAMLSSASIQSRALPALRAAVQAFPCIGMCDAHRVENELVPLCHWYRRDLATSRGIAVTNLRQRAVVKKGSPPPTLSRRRLDDDGGGDDEEGLDAMIAECQQVARLAMLNRPFLWGDVHFGKCKLRPVAPPSQGSSTKAIGPGLVVVSTNNGLESLHTWHRELMKRAARRKETCGMTTAPSRPPRRCCILLVDEALRCREPTLSYAVVVDAACELDSCDWNFFVADTLGWPTGEEEVLAGLLLHAANQVEGSLDVGFVGAGAVGGVRSTLATAVVDLLFARVGQKRCGQGGLQEEVVVSEEVRSAFATAFCGRSRPLFKGNPSATAGGVALSPSPDEMGLIELWKAAARDVLQVLPQRKSTLTEASAPSPPDSPPRRKALELRLQHEAEHLSRRYSVAPSYLLPPPLAAVILRLDPFTEQPLLRQALDTYVDRAECRGVPVLPASHRKALKHTWLRIAQQYHDPHHVHKSWQSLPVGNTGQHSAEGLNAATAASAGWAHAVVRHCSTLALVSSPQRGCHLLGGITSSKKEEPSDAFKLIDTVADLSTFSAALQSMRDHVDAGGPQRVFLFAFDTEFDCVVSTHDKCCVLQVALYSWDSPLVTPISDSAVPSSSSQLRKLFAAAIDTIQIPSAAVRDFVLAHLAAASSPTWIKLCHAPANDLAIFARDFGVPPSLIGPLVDTCTAEVLLRRKVDSPDYNPRASSSPVTGDRSVVLWNMFVSQMGWGSVQGQNEGNVGLGSLMDSYLQEEERDGGGHGAKMMKKDKYLKFTSWASRPLEPTALAYAMKDCTALPSIFVSQCRRMAAQHPCRGSNPVDEWLVEVLQATAEASAAVSVTASSLGSGGKARIDVGELSTCERLMLLRSEGSCDVVPHSKRVMMLTHVLLWRNELASTLSVQPALMLGPHLVAALADTLLHFSQEFLPTDGSASCDSTKDREFILRSLHDAIGGTPFVTLPHLEHLFCSAIANQNEKSV